MLPWPCNFSQHKTSVQVTYYPNSGLMTETTAWQEGILSSCQQSKRPFAWFPKLPAMVMLWHAHDNDRLTRLRASPDITPVFSPLSSQPTHHLPLPEHLDWSQPAVWDTPLPWNCPFLVWPGHWGSWLDWGVAEWGFCHSSGRRVLGQGTAGRFLVNGFNPHTYHHHLAKASSVTHSASLYAVDAKYHWVLLFTG